MENCSGNLQVINIVGMGFVDNGRSFQLEVIDSVAPHTTSLVTFKNVVALKLFQAGGEEFPLMVIDLTWRAVPAAEKKHTLQAHRFPFMNEPGQPLEQSGPLVAAHMEGAIVGDILAGEVSISTL